MLPLAAASRASRHAPPRTPSWRSTRSTRSSPTSSSPCRATPLRLLTTECIAPSISTPRRGACQHAAPTFRTSRPSRRTVTRSARHSPRGRGSPSWSPTTGSSSFGCSHTWPAASPCSRPLSSGATSTLGLRSACTTTSGKLLTAGSASSSGTTPKESRLRCLSSRTSTGASGGKPRCLTSASPTGRRRTDFPKTSTRASMRLKKL
mmetsp:Transcript_16514/g.39170  ORF Transcript_16514/g.39170 Transcript_16514/m.39170 type:complete len:206 (+) Transcript_16514:1569-2186(+)